MKHSTANNSKHNSKRNVVANKASNKQLSKQHAAKEHASTSKITAQQAATVQACNSNAMKTAQPGIIAHIMQCLLNAKQNARPVTAHELLAYLQQQFPQRSASGMLITVRAQLSRLPHEKDFAITKARNGRVVTYVAA